MKFFIAMIAMSFACSSHAYYEDHPKVALIAESGEPTLVSGSEQCPGSFDEKTVVDRLGSGDVGICVEEVRVPTAVAMELSYMQDRQLDNYSDYDQRLTKIHVFKSDQFNNERVTSWDIKVLKARLNIPVELAEDVTFKSYEFDESSLNQFSYLTLAEDYEFDEESRSLSYLRELLKGKKVIEVILFDGVELYPGGGIMVNFHLFLTEGMLVYVKHVGWDS